VSCLSRSQHTSFSRDWSSDVCPADLYEDAIEKNRRLIFDGLSRQNFDLSTPDGRFSARLFVSIANKSSEDTKRRIKRETRRMAEKGEFHGGKPAFGWDQIGRAACRERVEISMVSAGLFRHNYIQWA